ncbi:hypothetical protein EXIGLDRAFT_748677 [Exidia glandulosa HHB12029]|uniref:F-box domain-containing protein n=1 Tax=Exidia glandulosa HHB12029 TaxID=1314781 RepID=A0A165J5K9_EXIGL|nr:hypothetical protein EXIGLDRAFT_748677 [Exidia glandulosa HHB12029]
MSDSNLIHRLDDDTAAAVEVSILPSRIYRRQSSEPSAQNRVTRELLRALRLRARQVNAANTITQLPTDVVRRLLGYLGLTDRLALSHSCYNLHRLAFGIPHAWNSVHCDFAHSYVAPTRSHHDVDPRATIDVDIPPPSHPLRRVSWILARSTPLPVRLNLQTAFSEELLGIIAMYLPQLEVLELKLFSWDVFLYRNKYHCMPYRPGPSDVGRLLIALSAPAPHLRVLRLDAAYPWDGSVAAGFPPLRADTFNAFCPQLRMFTLRITSYPIIDNPAFASLTYLDYAVPTPSQMSALELDDLLSFLPKLETLGLTVKNFIGDPVELGTKKLATTSLKRVALDVSGPIDGTHHFAVIGSVMDDYADYFIANRVVDFAFVSANTFASPTRLLDTRLFRRVEIRDGAAFVCLDNGVAAHTFDQAAWHALVMSQSHSRLTTLAIGTYRIRDVFLQNPLFTCVPLLEDLCILVSFCSECSTSVRFVSPLSGDWPQPWHCPALRRVSIMRPKDMPTDREDRCTSMCAVSVQDIRAFLQNFSHLHSTRLERLSVSGIRLFGGDITDLEDLAEDLVVDFQSDVFTLRCLPGSLAQYWETAGPAGIFSQEETRWDYRSDSVEPYLDTETVQWSEAPSLIPVPVFPF